MHLIAHVNTIEGKLYCEICELVWQKCKSEGSKFQKRGLIKHSRFMQFHGCLKNSFRDKSEQFEL